MKSYFQAGVNLVHLRGEIIQFFQPLRYLA